MSQDNETAARQGCEGGSRHAAAALPWRICDGGGPIIRLHDRPTLLARRR